jgi:carboxyl-terminal processing protease
MPAADNGLLAGDEIMEIDRENISGKSSNYVSDKLKGQANTIIKIKYQRPGENKPRTVEFERKQIHINSVTYYGTLQDSIGYIYLSTFTTQTTQEIKAALDDLKRNHQVKYLILDLRNNGGGLMDDAIQLVNMFVPKGKVVVSTKAKVKQWDRTYRTTQAPLDEQIPLAVLVNGHSASSSEIVAGALQDLDRAVLVGSRTFGKGLVQTPRDIAYNGNLKVTISKYYIPSGRCIQAIDYTHRKSDGSADIIPDSLTRVFYTSKGRPVKDGGGITPDFQVETERISNITGYLIMDYIIFDFATEWKNKHHTIPPIKDFVFTDNDYETFKEFVKNKNFDYDRQSEKALNTLKEVMEFEGYLNSASEELKALEEKIQPNLDRDLDKYKKEISEQISSEIIKRYYFQSGEIQQSLKNDNTLDEAISILINKKLYNNTLRIDQ